MQVLRFREIAFRDRDAVNAIVSATERSRASPGRSGAIMKLSVPVANVPSASQSNGANWRKPAGEGATEGAMLSDGGMLFSPCLI